MAVRYWVGGTGTWDSTNTTNWSATSGGAGGASVPTSADTPQFNGDSGTGTVTFTNSGVTVGAVLVVNSEITLNLGAAFICSSTFSLTAGTLNTNNYNFTSSTFASTGSGIRSINLGSSIVTLNGANPLSFAVQTNLTFNAGTSEIRLSNATCTFSGSGLTFYNVNFTSSAISISSIDGANTFNNLTIRGKSSVGIGSISIGADQTVSGTLTISAGANALCRMNLQSTVLGTQRTISAASVVATDTDFRDIAITGTGAPASGTRLGDCKGNSGITFPAAKTVYFRNTISSNWGNGGSWSATSGGTADITQFPLAQDTAVFPSATYPSSGGLITINAAYNIGTIDMSGRTTNTVRINIASFNPCVYGNWINGTGSSLSGAATIIFSGQTAQTLLSAGAAFTQNITIDSPGGSLTLQDAFVNSRNSNTALLLTSGTFNANGYNVTLSGGTSAGFSSNNSNTRTLAIGSGTWTIIGTGSNSWNTSNITGLTVTGTGTLNFTGTTQKNFSGGGIQTLLTLNQGGVGTLLVLGSNKFASITNTARGNVLFQGGTTNEFTSFSLNGQSGLYVTLGSTNTTRAILKKPSMWYMGANSIDDGNNLNLTFTDGGDIDYLIVSYIDGQLSSIPVVSYNSNFFLFF